MRSPLRGMRSRFFLVIVVALAVGYGAPGWFRSLRDQLTCQNSGLASTPLCTSTSWRTAELDALDALAVLILLVVAYLLVRWALLPLGHLADTLARFGPQNMTERLPITAGRHDELGRVADALNQGLDRLSAGYEGQRRFAANAAHELRTPLAVQRTLIEVSMAGALSPDQLQLLTRQLLNTNERNVNLIEGLLVLAESDRGLASIGALRFDEVVTSVVQAHQERAALAEVSLTARVRERTVQGEKVLLERLVTNLVQNAIKYNRPGGSIVVEVDDEPALRVTNTGERVPAENIDGLFEPFRRLDRDRVNSDGGVGLGLTIVRSIAAAHHGRVSAEPHADGGLVVAVELPAG